MKGYLQTREHFVVFLWVGFSVNQEWSQGRIPPPHHPKNTSNIKLFLQDVFSNNNNNADDQCRNKTLDSKRSVDLPTVANPWPASLDTLRVRALCSCSSLWRLSTASVVLWWCEGAASVGAGVGVEGESGGGGGTGGGGGEAGVSAGCSSSPSGGM